MRAMTGRMGNFFLLVPLMIFTWVGPVLSQSSTHYALRFGAVSGGGGEAASGGYGLLGTLGQSSAVGVAASSSYLSYGGFWYLLEPEVAVSLTTWDFERVLIGQASDPKGVTITNPGTWDLVIEDLSVTGSSEFSLQNDHCSGEVLPPSGSCTFEVVFAPTTLGRKTATVSIPSNDEESPLTLALSGRGVRLMVDGEEGTIGSFLQIGGIGFGEKKGKVWIGTARLKVERWSSEWIEGTLTKALGPGPYDVVVTPKEPKGASSITEPGGFRVMLPEIEGLEPSSGGVSGEVTVRGRYFGTKKGKVVLGSSKGAKVKGWWMDEVTGESEARFEVPKGLAPGFYDVTITNKVGSGTKENGFRVE